MPNNINNNQKPLLDSQKEVIEIIEENFKKKINSLCCLGVGSGKTRIACEIIKNHIDNSNGKVVIACPNRILINDIWKETLAELNIAYLDLSSSEMDHRKLITRKKVFLYPSNCVIITTYKLLSQKDIDNIMYLDYFKDSGISLFVFDEMHILSNMVDNLKILREQIKEFPQNLRLGLTATPLVNSEKEIGEAFSILNNNTEEYDDSFFIYKAGNAIKNPCSETLFHYPLTSDEITDIETIESEYKNSLLTREKTSEYLITGKAETIRHSFYEGKRTLLQILTIIIEKIPAEDKVIIFSESIKSLQYLAKSPLLCHLNPVEIHGKVSRNDNKLNYHFFINNPDCKALLTTFQMSSEGINLQNANHVILLSITWTPKTLFQAIGRIKRQGQKKPCYAYVFHPYSLTKESFKISNVCLPEYFTRKHDEMKNLAKTHGDNGEVSLQLPKEVIIPPDKEIKDFILASLKHHTEIQGEYRKRLNMIKKAINKILYLFYRNYIVLSNNTNSTNMLLYPLIDNFSAIKTLQIQSVYQNWNFKKIFCSSLINKNYELLFQIIKPKRSFFLLYTVLDILSTHINDVYTVIPNNVYSEDEENTINIADNAYKDCELNLDEILRIIISLSSLSYNDSTCNVLLLRLKELIIPFDENTKDTVIDLDEE